MFRCSDLIMPLGETLGNMAGDLSNLNQQWNFANRGIVERFHFYNDLVPMNDSGNRLYTRGLGSGMILGSRQRGGLAGYAAYSGSYSNTQLIQHADGATTDAGPNAYTVTVSGTPSYVQFVIGSGYHFDGSGNFYTIYPTAVTPNISEGTFEAWISPIETTFPNRKVYMWAGQNGGNGTGATVDEMAVYSNSGTGRIRFSIFSGGTAIVNISGSTTMASGTRVHVAATWAGAGNYARLILDGRLDNSGLQSADFGTDNWKGFRVGRSSAAVHANADMDEVRVSTKARPLHELNYIKTFLGNSFGSFSQVGPSGLVI